MDAASLRGEAGRVAQLLPLGSGPVRMEKAGVRPVAEGMVVSAPLGRAAQNHKD